MSKAFGADPTVPNNVYMPQGGNSIVLRGTQGILSSENALWGNCPLSAWMLDPSIAVFLDEDFVSFNKAATDGDYTGTAATSGSAAIDTSVPGALKLDSGAATNHQGYQVQRLKSVFLPAAGKDIWAEFTVLLGTGLNIETFIGLSASSTTLIATGALGVNNRIGWSSVTGDGVLLQNCDKAGVGTTQAAVTLSLTVPHKLGFYYDGTADTVQQFIDGVATGPVIPTANIPKAAIYPSLVCQSTGTAQPTMSVRGYRVFQLR